MTELLALSAAEIAALAVICFVAGMVRGFSGFALSALVMSVAVAILPPVQLIPILWFLEMAASVLMAHGGWRDADRRAALLLIVGNWVGWPIGLWLTTSISVAASKSTVLVVVLVLAATQLKQLRLPFLATGIGTLITGVVAGVISGLAHVGGMIVALYALARQTDAKTMRGTLVTYLFIGALGSLAYQIAFGVMDQSAAMRGVFLILPTVAGVWVGQKMFVEKWHKFYRPICLWLLIGLALASLARHLIQIS